jgi:nucleoside-diphosphate-sugar epimerase
MRILLAGATGAIGRRLLPMLIADGHQVSGMTRSPEKVSWLSGVGAEPVVCDALDGPAVAAAVHRARPDAVIHQLTAIPQRLNPRTIKRDFVLNDRLRSEGTRHLVAAAQAASVSRLIAQSVAFVYAPNGSGAPHGEQDPLLADVPRQFRRTLNALRDLERAVTQAQGTVLRYGYIYGPGTSICASGSLAEQARSRQLPIVGGGSGVWSFVHVDDAARATVAALSGPPGVYNIVDDEPAPVRDWVPVFSQVVGAPPALRLPTFLARIIAGPFGVLTMTRVEGASNALAYRQLGWRPHLSSWREGFRTALG